LKTAAGGPAVTRTTTAPAAWAWVVGCWMTIEPKPMISPRSSFGWPGSIATVSPTLHPAWL